MIDIIRGGGMLNIKRILFILIISTLCNGIALAEPVVIRVSILSGQSGLRLCADRNLIVRNADSLKVVGTFGRITRFSTSGSSIIVNGKNAQAKNIYVTTGGMRDILELNGVAYRGYFLIALDGAGKMSAINYLNLDDYIAGVLGGEIIPSWPVESIKAQAVAARSYVLFKVDRSRGRLYDVVNNTADQMYVGVRGETPATVRAVAETTGQVLTRDGRIICAYYHSACGGGTADSWNVFSHDMGGLMGNKCPYCAGAPNSRWQVSFDSDKIRNRLNAGGFRIGRILSIKPATRDRNGRVIYLEVVHEQGTMYILTSDFRRVMGYGVLKSTRFDLKPAGIKRLSYTGRIAPGREGLPLVANVSHALQVRPVTASVPTSYVFSGAGWGHGVGMCQWGARGMAKLGFKYRDILKHYYPGTSLRIAKKAD